MVYDSPLIMSGTQIFSTPLIPEGAKREYFVILYNHWDFVQVTRGKYTPTLQPGYSMYIWLLYNLICQYMYHNLN